MIRKVFTNYDNNRAIETQLLDGRNAGPGRVNYHDGYTVNVGSPFIDIRGGSGLIGIAAQLQDVGDEGEQVYAANLYEMPESKQGIEDARVAESRARYWTDDEYVVGWEVGANKQVVFLDGIRYDLADVIDNDLTIRAACMVNSDASLRLLVKKPDNAFATIDLELEGSVFAKAAEIDVPLQYTETTWRETDIKQLYSAFLDASTLVTVQLQQDATKVLLLAKEGDEWQEPREIASFKAVTANCNLTYYRKMPVPSVLSGGGAAISNVVISHGVVSKVTSASDDVSMTGERVVACNSNNTQIALLIEEVDTTCTRTIRRPAYSYNEFYWLQQRPIMVGPWVVGYAFDVQIKLDGFDSGKLFERWERTANNHYRRVLIDIDVTEKKGAITEGTRFSGGEFSSLTEHYERFGQHDFNMSWQGTPVPPPMTDILYSMRGNGYEENKHLYRRNYSGAIKFYCADPLNDFYLYEQMTGVIERDFMSYDVRGYIKPDDDDLITKNHYDAVMTLVVRSGEEVEGISSLLIEEALELGLHPSYRYLLNFEPTMPYYTQEQPKMIGDVTSFEAVVNREISINKSIDLGFQGRYSASVGDNVMIAYNMENDFDKPDIRFPNFVDSRYRYYTEGLIWADIQTLKYFFEAYRPCISKPEVGDSLYIDFRLFEDRHRITCNNGVSSGEIDIPLSAIPAEWPDIRGWFDFVRRGGFYPWATVKGMVYPEANRVADDDNPPITLLKDIDA